MPVFSFGENDVCSVSLSDASGTDRQVDIPANAKSKGNYCTRATEEVPKRLRLYIASIPWTWVVELYARRALHVGRGYPS